MEVFGNGLSSSYLLGGSRRYAFELTSSPKANLPRSTVVPASRLHCPPVPSPLITQVAQHTPQLQTTISIDDDEVSSNAYRREPPSKYEEESPLPNTSTPSHQD